MAKTKEGRRRMSTLDFRTEAGRILFNDLNNPRTSGISPFLESDYQSIRFWKSRPQYQEISFAAFRGQAENMAKIVRAQMTPEAEEAELSRIQKNRGPIQNKDGGEKKIAKSKKDANSNHIDDGYLKPTPSKLQVQRSVMPLRESFNVPSLRDTIVAPHPNGEMAIVIFELDGDTDEKACQLQFAQEGRKIMVYSRIPSELTNAASLLGKADNRSSIQDADCMLLDLAIKERLKGSTKDDNGNVWEVREVIDLPFQCKNSFFNKHRKRISTYLLRKNDHGYAWGYFWVVASQVGQQHKGPIKIGCKTTSDEESDHEYDDNSCLSSSEEEVVNNTDEKKVESDIDEMEVEFESMELSEMKAFLAKTDDQEVRRPNNNLEDEIRELKSSYGLKQTQLNMKNDELIKLKDESLREIASLRSLLEQERKQNMETESERAIKQQREIEELLRKVNLLENDLESKKNCYLHEIASLNELLEQEKKQRKETESENSMMEQMLRKKNELEAKENSYLCEIAKLEQEKKTESERTMKQQREMEELLCKAHCLENELKNSKEKDRQIKDLQAKENGNKSNLEKCRQNIDRLESKIERLKVDNQVKQQYIMELEQCCEKKGQDLLKAEQAHKERLAKMVNEISKYTQLLQETNERMVVIENENAKKVQTSFDTIQRMEQLLLEKEQQNVYQMDQIERLTCHVAEIGQATLEKDSLIQRYLKEIQGLKNHLLQQRDIINALEREANERRRSRNGVRLTDGLFTDEERNLEFSDLNRWDSEKSMKVVSPKNPHSDNREDTSSERHHVHSDGAEHIFTKSESDYNKENTNQNATINQERSHKSDDADLSPNNNRRDGGSARSTTDLPTDKEGQDLPTDKEGQDNENISPPKPHSDQQEDTVCISHHLDSDGATQFSQNAANMKAEEVLNVNMTTNEDFTPILHDEESIHIASNTPSMEAPTTGDHEADEKDDANENPLHLLGASSDPTEDEKPPQEEAMEDNIEKDISINAVTNDQTRKTTELSQHQNMVVKPEKKSRKRKSVTDLREEHTFKKIRKSQRLQEKRMAKLKPKVD